MTREEAYNQYLHEVALFEQWGSKNTTTFDEWLEIKNIKLEQQPQGLDEPRDCSKGIHKQEYTGCDMSWMDESQRLDEAAEEALDNYDSEFYNTDDDGSSEPLFDMQQMLAMFKAGAKWMAGQGGYFEDTVFLFQNHPMLSGVAIDCVSALEKAGVKSGDKVIIQIRKK